MAHIPWFAFAKQFAYLQVWATTVFVRAMFCWAFLLTLELLTLELESSKHQFCLHDLEDTTLLRTLIQHSIYSSFDVEFAVEFQFLD